MEKITVNPSVGKSILKLMESGDSKTALLVLLVYAGVFALPYAIEGVEQLAHDAMEHGYFISFKVGNNEVKLDKTQTTAGMDNHTA